MTLSLPKIIQGGMGVGVSSAQLANTVSKHGQLGVVSGTALGLTFARRLMQKGNDVYIEALKHFPFKKMAERILKRFHPKQAEDPFKMVEMPSIHPSEDLNELIVAANFVEVHLAKKGHQGMVGINFLEKIQFPTLASIYGAILAGVDYILMGAGIPHRIPDVIQKLSNHEEAVYPIKVQNDLSNDIELSTFSPKSFAKDETLPKLKKPQFLAIIGSHTLATYLMKSEFGTPDGFVVEMPIAGGHNAPPRGRYPLTESGEPIYGERDIVDFETLKALNKPFWLAGGYGHPDALKEALSLGAVGIQVGTAFAFSNESGFEASLKQRVLRQVLSKNIRVKTDIKASPTGFPFKVASVEGTLSEDALYASRTRICDLGYLREAYRKENGSIGYRCPSEPVEDYVRKGGKIEDTIGRKCLCNGLVAGIGLGQKRKSNQEELPLVTSGDDLLNLSPLIHEDTYSYSAVEVLNYILTASYPKA